jgi:hypothetical protein
MRKLLLIALLAFGTVAWAQANFDHSQQMNQGFSDQRGGEDWYNRVLGAQVDQAARINQTLAPSQTASLEQENFAQPGAIAANAGTDWYNQKVAAEAEMNGRIASALKSEALKE